MNFESALALEHIRAALLEAVGSALSAEEIQKLVDEELPSVNGKKRHRQAAEIRMPKHVFQRNVMAGN